MVKIDDGLELLEEAEELLNEADPASREARAAKLIREASTRIDRSRQEVVRKLGGSMTDDYPENTVESAVQMAAHGQAITMIEDGIPEEDGRDVAVENALDTYQYHLECCAADLAEFADRDELRPIAVEAVDKAYAGETTNLDELRGGE